MKKSRAPDTARQGWSFSLVGRDRPGLPDTIAGPAVEPHDGFCLPGGGKQCRTMGRRHAHPARWRCAVTTDRAPIFGLQVQQDIEVKDHIIPAPVELGPVVGSPRAVQATRDLDWLLAGLVEYGYVVLGLRHDAAGAGPSWRAVL